MKRIIKSYLDRYFDKKFQNIATEIGQRQQRMTEEGASLSKKLLEVEAKIDQNLVIAKKNYDNIPFLRQRLLGVRRSREYEAVYKQQEPLITVRIATYNRHEELIERAVKSVLNQTYKNWELIVVGDHCTDSTEEEIKKLNNPKIKFYNLPYRSVYPENNERRWMVAGSPGMNKGAELAKGDWIAPLDDDDEFSSDHLEKLVSLALKDRLEVAYGKLVRIDEKTKQKMEIWSYPPEYGSISSQSMLYMKLIDFFEWDTASWVVEEPGDWNLLRRMLEAGVKFGTIEDVVGTIYYTHYIDKK